MSVTTEAGTPTVNSAWTLEVDTSAVEGTPEWTPVKGCSGISPTVNYTTQDATDYDSEGWGADVVTLRKWQVTATAFRKRYAGALDEGQEALRQAAEDLELAHVRFYDRSDALGEAYEGYASVQWAPTGGDATGLQTVSITLLGQGARTSITNPTTVTP